jgi:transcriptional regulator with PAS, ATPase and Fis domain
MDFFIEKYSLEIKKDRVFFSPRVQELFFHYPWPGNVRELQNEIQRCIILSGEEKLVREEHLSSKINPRSETALASPYNFFEAKAEFVRRFLGQALSRTNFNKARTAEEIGLSRQGLFKLMKKYKIEVSPNSKN